MDNPGMFPVPTCFVSFHMIGRGTSFSSAVFSRLSLASSKGPSSKDPSLIPSTCTAYSLSQLQQATDGWSDANLLGRGGFGEVYRGVDPQNPSFVMAVKRATVQTTKFREEVCFELLYMDGVNLCSL